MKNKIGNALSFMKMFYFCDVQYPILLFYTMRPKTLNWKTRLEYGYSCIFSLTFMSSLHLQSL